MRTPPSVGLTLHGTSNGVGGPHLKDMAGTPKKAREQLARSEGQTLSEEHVPTIEEPSLHITKNDKPVLFKASRPMDPAKYPELLDEIS